MTMRAIVTVAAQGRATLANALERAESKSKRFNAEKKQLYATEDALMEQLKEKEAEGEEFKDSSVVKKVAVITGSVFGLRKGEAEAPIEIAQLSLQVKKLNADLDVIKKQDGRMQQALHEAVTRSNESAATVQHGLQQANDVVRSRNSGQTALGGKVATAALSVESAQMALAYEIHQSATASADRHAAHERATTTEALATHAKALEHQKRTVFGLKVARLVGTAVTAVGSISAFAMMPTPGLGGPLAELAVPLAKAGQWAVGNFSASGTLGVTVKMGGEQGAVHAASDDKAKSARMQTRAAQDADASARAEKRSQAALQMAGESRQSVNELRDHRNSLRA